MFNFIFSIFLICSTNECGWVEALKSSEALMMTQKERIAGKVQSELKGRAEMKKNKGYPEYATYLEVSSFFERRVGAWGFSPVQITAKMPGGEPDTTYQDTVDLKAVKENTTGSVEFYLNVGFGPDTTNPVTSVKLNNGEAFLWIRNSQAERLILWAIPRDSLKPSHPLAWTIEESAVSPARIKIDGPSRINPGDFSGRYLVRVVSLSGAVAVNTFLDPVSVSIKVIEENPDSSASVTDLLLGSGQSVNCALISGQANIFLSNSSVERVTLVAEHNFGFLLPDTFEVEVVPANEGTTIFPLSFSGAYGTQGIAKSILAVALVSDGPDINNNSSVVELFPYDIMGSVSASISPAGPQTMVSGLTSFTLENSEADSGVIVETICSGTPALFPNWFIGDKITYGFKEPGKATLIRPSGQSSAIVGDTITVFAYAVDATGTLDSTYNGWAYVWIEDNNGSCELLEYGTGIPQDIVHIQNGIGKAWLTNSEIEEVLCGFEDAEGGFPFVYLGSNTPDEGVSISFVEPGDSATKWALELPQLPGGFPAGQWITATIKAVDDSNMIDTTFQDSAKFEITGFAVPESALVAIRKGIGTIEFKNDSIETVEVTVSGGELLAWQDSVKFVTPDRACLLVVLAPDEMIVRDSINFAFYAMKSTFEIDNTWNGVAKVEYIDPGDQSVIWVGDPDSIPIINGVGRITAINTEVESVFVSLKYVSGEPPLAVVGEIGILYFKANINAIVPDMGTVGAFPDTLIFRVEDSKDSLVEYSTWLNIWHVEEIPNGSVVLTPQDSVQLINGIGIVEIENTEEETVWIYGRTSDELIMERDSLLGIIVFKLAGVEEKLLPMEFLVKSVSSNPAHKEAMIQYQLPVKSDVHLKIYDMAGREVKTLVNKKETAGYYIVKWDGKDNLGNKLANGVYFYKFSANLFTDTKKIVLLK